jgi:predicted NBD/HSP70 family sugar kinase
MPTQRISFTNNLSASNKIPRQINRNLIFNQIRLRQPISRAELARTSGLQRSTVSLIVEELLAEKWIVEGQTGQIPRGRRPTFLQLNGQRGVLALDIHPAQTALAVTDLSGKIVDHRTIQLPEDPGKVLGAILDAIQAMIARHSDRSFDGIGMTLPGRFDPRREESIFAPNVGWPIGQIKSEVEQATGLKVAVDNVANACALSEVWFGSSDGMHDLVVVSVSEGIGTGIFANGRLLRGEGGFAGEFGHVQLEPNGVSCGCGGRGCWETIASNRAALRYYLESTGQALADCVELLERAEAGEAAATEAIARMCDALGRGMHMIASALAPSEIVVVGDIGLHWKLTGPMIEAGMRSSTLARTPTLRPAAEGSRARLRSAAALLMNENHL